MSGTDWFFFFKRGVGGGGSRVAHMIGINSAVPEELPHTIPEKLPHSSAHSSWCRPLHFNTTEPSCKGVLNLPQ